jgi:hypothetical protein
VFIMFRHVALHDLFHAYRIEELLLKLEWATEWRLFAGEQPLSAQQALAPVGRLAHDGPRLKREPLGR